MAADSRLPPFLLTNDKGAILVNADVLWWTAATQSDSAGNSSSKATPAQVSANPRARRCPLLTQRMLGGLPACDAMPGPEVRLVLAGPHAPAHLLP
eukprot:1882610-Rhodomonas_salina.3